MGSLPICQLTLRGFKPLPAAYPQALDTLGDWIRKTRLDQGLFQMQVADRFGVDEATITNWELHRTEPEVRYIPKIIEFIGYCPYIPTADPIARLSAIRWALGLSQEKLAKLMGVDESSLCSWERGEHSPTNKSRTAILGFLSSLTPYPPQE